MFRVDCHIRRFSAAAVCILLFSGCGEEEFSQEAPQEALLELGFEGRTTRGETAARNLHSQVQGRQAAARLQPDNLATQSQWIDVLLQRSHFLGIYSDLDRADTVATQVVTERRDDDGAKILKARVDSARHRFSDAQSVLDNLDRSNVASEDLRSTLRLALENDLEALRDQKRQIAEEFPSYRTLSTWASIEAALGDFEEADRLYVEALRTYNDVSPFPVAWVMFQRGVMWAESADRPERALPLYREAVRRLPSYVVAQVHLAELEAETGDVDDAISRLRSIAEETEDPEPAGLLGELLMDSDPIEAQRWIERARSIYDDLLKRHPEAFAHHGAEFFSGPGDDPERALELALANLGHRPVERAFLVAIEVAHSAGRSELACTLAEQAGPHGANLILRKRVRETMGHCEES